MVKVNVKLIANYVLIAGFGFFVYLLIQVVNIDLIDNLIVEDIRTGRVGGITGINLLLWTFTLAAIGGMSISTFFTLGVRKVYNEVLFASILTIMTMQAIAIGGMLLRPDVRLSIVLVQAQFLAFVIRSPQNYMFIVIFFYVLWISIYLSASKNKKVNNY